MTPAEETAPLPSIASPLLGGLLAAEFPNARLSLRDSRYFIPALNPLIADLQVQLPAVLRALGVPPSWRERFDCDKFAGMAHAVVAAKYALRPEPDAGAPEGAAFGVILFIRRDGVGHAINVCLAHDEAGEPRLVGIEPQTGELYPMTDAEKASVWEVVL